MIVAADSRWGIGSKGRLLARIPDDLKFFSQVTSGKTVIMGHKTLLTLPAGQPLKLCRNIILSRDPELVIRGAQVVHSVEEALAAVADVPDEDVYVIGGEQIYHAFLPWCKVAHVTRMDYAYEADAWCPDLDADPAWQLMGESEEQTCFDLIYSFRLYARREALDEVRDYLAPYMGG